VSGSRQPRGLGYNFAPVPWRAVERLRTGELSRDELAVLLLLYRYANRDSWRVLPRTLIWIGEGVGWRKTHDALRKLLHRLRAAGELDWPPSPGSSIYAFKLYPDGDGPGRPVPKSSDEQSVPGSGDRSQPAGEHSEVEETAGRSERIPRSKPASDPRSSGAERPSGAAIRPNRASSVPRSTGGREPRPSERLAFRSEVRGCASPVMKRDGGVCGEGAFRGPSEVQIGKNSHRGGETVLGEGTRAVGADSPGSEVEATEAFLAKIGRVNESAAPEQQLFPSEPVGKGPDWA
jgi:hypothetical protein